MTKNNGKSTAAVCFDPFYSENWPQIGKNPFFVQKTCDISKTHFLIEVELEIIFFHEIWPSFGQKLCKKL